MSQAFLRIFRVSVLSLAGCLEAIACPVLTEPPTSPSPQHSARSVEELKQIFQQSAEAIHKHYRKALAQHPGLRGRIVFEMEISPDGMVSLCRVASSDLRNPELENQMASELRRLNFGPKGIEPMQLSFPGIRPAKSH